MSTSYSKMVGVGSFLPEKVVTNDDLASLVDTSDEWIRTRTGIRERRVAADGQLASDLALPAARQALECANVSSAELDMIIVATTTPDQLYPSTACILQDKLGISGCGAFDVQAVCSGFVYALMVADGFVRSGSARRVLVVGAEVYSHILDWNDRSTCILFGDGAGAAVLAADSEPGILCGRLRADGSHKEKLCVPAHVNKGVVEGRPYTVMDGGAVYKFAVKAMSDISTEVCAEADVPMSDVNWFVPHQANSRIIDAVANRVGVPKDRIVCTVERHGNTSAASVPLALAEKWSDFQEGQHVLMATVGGGFTWGAALLRL